MAPDGVNVAGAAALLLMGSWLLERWWVPRFRPDLYFRVGLPLGADPVGIPAVPEGSGQTATVAWESRGDQVIFWSAPDRRSAPAGLHGRVTFVPRRGPGGPGGYDLAVIWSPPWAAFAAPIWVASLGLLRGEGLLIGGTAAVIAVAVGLAYRMAALRASAELRWAFVQADG